jgi:hypothetical protein
MEKVVRLIALIWMSILILLVAAHLMTNLDYFALSKVIFFFSFYSVILGPIFLNSQSNWILVLPFKKIEILRFSLFANLSILLSSVFAALLLVLALSFIDKQNCDLLFKTFSNFHDFSENLTDELFFSWTPSVWAICSCSIIFVLSFWIALGNKHNQLSNNFLGYQRSKYRVPTIKEFLISALVIFSAIVLRNFILTGYGGFILATVYLFFVGRKICHNLGAFGSTRKRWMTAFALIAVTQFILISVIAIKGIHSDLAVTELNSRNFLGAWIPNSNNTQSENRGNSFQKTVISDQDSTSILNKMKFYDAKNLNVKDVEILFDHLVTLKTPYQYSPYIRKVFLVTFSQEDLIRFLNDKNMMKVRFALNKIRNERSDFYLQPILNNLSRYPEEEKQESLDALSHLTGAFKGLDFYANWKNKKSISLDFYKNPDCNLLRARKMEDLRESDEGILNICLHQVLLKKYGLNGENIAWVHLPIEDRYFAYYRNNLGIH